MRLGHMQQSMCNRIWLNLSSTRSWARSTRTDFSHLNARNSKLSVDIDRATIRRFNVSVRGGGEKTIVMLDCPRDFLGVSISANISQAGKNLATSQAPPSPPPPPRGKKLAEKFATFCP